MNDDLSCNVLRSVQSVRSFTLFNLEGTVKQYLNNQTSIWGVSSAGRAPALQAGGHRFDPGTLHQEVAPKQSQAKRICFGEEKQRHRMRF